MKEKATQCKDTPISREQHPIKTAINVFYSPRGQAVTQKQRFRRRQLSLGSGRVGKVSMLAAKLKAVNFQRRSKKLALTQCYLKILLSAQTHDVAPDDEFPHSSHDCFFIREKPVFASFSSNQCKVCDGFLFLCCRWEFRMTAACWTVTGEKCLLATGVESAFEGIKTC